MILVQSSLDVIVLSGKSLDVRDGLANHKLDGSGIVGALHTHKDLCIIIGNG